MGEIISTAYYNLGEILRTWQRVVGEWTCIYTSPFGGIRELPRIRISLKCLALNSGYSILSTGGECWYQFTSVLAKAISALNKDTKAYKSHSFRIGASTEMTMRGLSSSVIQNSGRWVSNCFRTYIRIPKFWRLYKANNFWSYCRWAHYLDAWTINHKACSSRVSP